jgi:hypothetical protein
MAEDNPKIEVAVLSEILVLLLPIYQTTQCHIAEGCM